MMKKTKNHLASICITERDTVCGESIYALIEAELITESLLGELVSRVDFYDLTDAVKQVVIEDLIEAGVIIRCPESVTISPFVKIGEGTIIRASCEIRRNTVIGKNCDIGPCSVIENSRIGDDCIVNATQIYDSTLDANVKIGPFCHVRPNSHLCSGVKIGDFVEVKNSTVGCDSHASHLTYIGDSDVGERVNFGCGVVTVNYDGINKHRCVIGNDAFIGCNTNLVAPVTLEDGAYTAAGSTITDNVPADALAIDRARQTNIEGWNAKHKLTPKKPRN